MATKKDHIAPWQSIYQGFQAMQGHKTFVLGGSGHVAGIVIPPGKENMGIIKTQMPEFHPMNG